MYRSVRVLLPALLALGAAASVANAQSAGPQSGERMRREHRPSAETMQRMEDGRFAMIKGALKMTDAQAKLWQPVEDVIRAQHAQRTKAMTERAAGRDNDAKGNDGKATEGRSSDGMDRPRSTLADRMERDSARMTERAEQAKTYSAAFRPFFDSLTEDQRAVAGPLLAGFAGEHRGHGHRWASREEHGERHGDK